MGNCSLGVFSAGLICASFLAASTLCLVDDAPQPVILKVGDNDAGGFLATLERLRQLRENGRTESAVIEIPPGTYRFAKTVVLTPKLVASGLTLKAVKKKRTDEVVFSGGVVLTPAKRSQNGWWRYKLPRDWKQFGFPRTLIIDRKQRTAARHPNEGFLRVEKPLADRRSGFTVPAGSLPSGFDPKLSPCDLVFLHDWSSSRLPVASFDSVSRTLRTVGPIGCAAPHYAIDHFEKHPRFWLEGASAFADRPGEWFVDREAEEVVLVGDPGAKRRPQVILPRLVELLVATGTDETPIRKLKLEGITFSESRFPMPPGGLAAGQATVHEPRDVGGRRTTRDRVLLAAAVRIERAVDCQVVNCRFRSLGGTALWLGSRTKRCRVARCRIVHVGGNGINLGEDNSRRVNGKPWYRASPGQVPSDNRVEECNISFCGELLPGSVGIWGGLQKRVTIADNLLRDLPYTGISLGWMWNPSATPAGENRIRGNRIEFVMQMLSDGGGIYTLGRQPGSVIENNIISDVPTNAGRAESNGMFFDQGTTGFEIRDNTIRRVSRSPLRFHRAGRNRVVGNRWELSGPETPPVRYNATAKANIILTNNTVIAPQKQIYLIGNSLTWDTVPSKLDERVLWHIDCGTSLKRIYDHPDSPCVDSSRIWPVALRSMQFDFLCIQPHYARNLAEDVAVISRWIEMQPNAQIIIHTGWAPHKKLKAEWADTDPAGPATHSSAYVGALLERLRKKYPKRSIRSTHAMEVLHRVWQDIKNKKAPFRSIEELYRDAVHMTHGPGRYLMHNVMRKALGQPPNRKGWPHLAQHIQGYLDSVVRRR